MTADEGRPEGAALRGSAWLTAINISSKGLQTVVTVVLALLLDERQMGLAAYVATLVNVGVVLETVGVHDVIARTRHDRRRMAGTLRSLSVLVAGVLGLAVVVLRNPLAGAAGAPEAGPLLIVVALSLPFFALSGAQNGLANGTLQFRRRLAPDLANAAVNAVVTLSLAAAGFGALALALGILAGAVVQAAGGTMVGLGIRLSWDRTCAVEAMRWIRFVGPGALIAVLLVNVDYLIVGAVLGPEDLGVYSLAFRVIWLPYLTVTMAIAAASFPLYVRVIRRDGHHTATVVRVTHLAVVVLGGVYVLVALLAPHIAVLGARWAPAAAVIVALSPYGFLLALALLWCEALRAADRPRLYLALQVIHLVVVVGLLVPLSTLGILGTAVGQSAATLVLAVLTFLALRWSGTRLPVTSLLRPLGVLLVGGALAGVASRLASSLAPALGAPPVVAFVVDLVAVTGVYLAVVVSLDRRLFTMLWTARPGRVALPGTPA